MLSSPLGWECLPFPGGGGGTRKGKEEDMKLAQRIELLHRSSQRMMDSLVIKEAKDKDKAWWAVMKKKRGYTQEGI
jgi:hypothetical protein